MKFVDNEVELCSWKTFYLIDVVPIKFLFSCTFHCEYKHTNIIWRFFFPFLFVCLLMMFFCFLPLIVRFLKLIFFLGGGGNRKGKGDNDRLLQT